MELNNILNKKEQKTPPVEKFLAVEIQESQVKTAVWSIQNNQPKILNFGPTENWNDQESLLLAVDKSLGSALKNNQTEPNRVILGLPESWVKGNNILSQQQPLIKELTKKLELEPIGFVVITEAVIQQLKIEEGIPPSLILLELGETKVNVVVIKLGQVVGRQEVGRSGDLGQDVEEGLARIEVKQLPSRILILNGAEPDVEQQLSSYPWQDKLPFLHLPKVEKPDQHFSIQAVALAGGTEAARSLGIEVLLPETSSEELSSDSFSKAPPAPSASDAQDFVTQDIAQTSTSSQAAPPSPTTPDKSQPKQLSQIKKYFTKRISGLFSFLKNFHFPSQLLRLPKLQLPKPWIIALPLGLLLILLISGWLAYNRFSSADITVFVKPKKISQTITIAISEEKQGIPTLNAQQDTVELESQGTLNTSGETLVGDPAIGEVTLYNKTNSPKELEAGTLLTTSDNLEFTLNESIKIASQTATTNEEEITTLVPGQATASVNAQDVGEEGNLEQDIELSVATYPKTSLLAKTKEDFTDGYSETVKSPSQEDLEKLLEQVSKKIARQSKEKLQKNQNDNQTTVPVTDPEIISTNYSAQPGNQADKLTLDLKAKFTLLTYQDKQLVELIKNELKDSIPSGWQLEDENTQTEFLSLTSKDGALTAKIKIDSQLLPQVPLEDYQNQLKNMSLTKTKRLLESISGYQRAQASISPNVPFLGSRLPPRANRINISIKPI